MHTDQCSSYYERYVNDEVTHVRCTYIASHTSDHSWRTLQLQDEADREAQLQRVGLDNTDVEALLKAIDDGDYDAYLEAILTFAHNRKRTLRGVRGFPELMRRRADR